MDVYRRILYSASPLFRKEYDYAVKIIGASEIYILSAKHHLISGDTVIAPYNVTLLEMNAAERRAWAQIAINQIREKFEPQDTILYFLCGSRYYEYIEEALSVMGFKYEIPLKGKGGIGKQLQWLSLRLE